MSDGWIFGDRWMRFFCWFLYVRDTKIFLKCNIFGLFLFTLDVYLAFCQRFFVWQFQDTADTKLHNQNIKKKNERVEV